jgi:hypothetical protein
MWMVEALLLLAYTKNAASYLLIIKHHWPIKDDKDQCFAEFAISFILAALHTL